MHNGLQATKTERPVSEERAQHCNWSSPPPPWHPFSLAQWISLQRYKSFGSASPSFHGSWLCWSLCIKHSNSKVWQSLLWACPGTGALLLQNHSPLTLPFVYADASMLCYAGIRSGSQIHSCYQYRDEPAAGVYDSNENRAQGARTPLDVKEGESLQEPFNVLYIMTANS